VTGRADVVRVDSSSTEVDAVQLADNVAGNLELVSNAFYRSFTDAIPLTEQALALPDMQGSGVLRDLREAMSLGTPEAAQLVVAVQVFAAANTAQAQKALIDDVLVAWAATGPDVDAALKGMTAGYVTLSGDGVSAGYGQQNFEAARFQV
jgi:hypothetical protein